MMDESEEQAKLDKLVRDLARCGGVSERSAWRLVQDLFFHEGVTDHYVHTECGFVTMGLSIFDPGPPLEPVQEIPDWVNRLPDNQPKPVFPTEATVEELNAQRREMRFSSLPAFGRPDHYQWHVAVIEEDAPEILRIWNRYCASSLTLTRYQMMLESSGDGVMGGDWQSTGEGEASQWVPWTKASIQEFLRDAQSDWMMAKRVWNRERRKYWPVRLVVDNAAGNDGGKVIS
ncbi:hypothetical protein ACJU26_05995 [Acidithiobacillus sp. M4-SHS-6]|uniref:hypothetical protein n=1 Tax=Acidithiobacillus sp. M4-SHS-6 TaxID=3383024 RepID=UPI0039BDAF56